MGTLKVQLIQSYTNIWNSGRFDRLTSLTGLTKYSLLAPPHLPSPQRSTLLLWGDG